MELPTEIINSFKKLNNNTEKMLMDMTRAGAEVVYNKVKANMKSSFKTTESLDKGLKITRSYRTLTDDGINTKIGFYGFNAKGIPIPLIAMAREFGTSKGERKKPFFRKAFNQKEAIKEAMIEVQRRYIDE